MIERGLGVKGEIAWPIVTCASACLQQALWAFEGELYGLKNRSTHTLSAYGSDLREFIGYLAREQLEQKVELAHLSSLTLQSLRAFLCYLREEGGCMPSTMARKISSLRSFYRFLEVSYGIKNDRIRLLRLPRKARLLPKPVSEAAACSILTFLGEESGRCWVAMRDRALLGVLYGCGLRLGEALSLSALTDTREQLIVRGKRQKHRIVPMLGIVSTWVENYRASCPHIPNREYSALFFGLRGKPLQPRQARAVVACLRRRLNLSEKITPHSFRHAFATHLLRAGANLRQVQELLGHASLRSTQIYTEVTDRDMVNQYRSAHPRDH